MNRTSYKVALLVMIALFCMPGIGFGQTLQPTPSDDDVNRIASQLFCPVCEDARLDSCNTEVCMSWRDEIRNQLAEGKSDEEILSFFVNQFGSQVLAEPVKERWLFNLLPFLIFLSGLLVTIWVYRTRKVNLPLSEPQTTRDENISGGN